MNQNHQPTLRIHGPVDLISGIPYLLGFTPEESLVLMGLTHGTLVVTARIDLADVVYSYTTIEETLAAMTRGGSTQFVTATSPPGTAKRRDDAVHGPRGCGRRTGGERRRRDARLPVGHRGRRATGPSPVWPPRARWPPTPAMAPPNSCSVRSATVLIPTRCLL